VTEFLIRFLVNFGTHKAAAKHELLFIKPTWVWYIEQKLELSCTFRFGQIDKNHCCKLGHTLLGCWLKWWTNRPQLIKQKTLTEGDDSVRLAPTWNSKIKVNSSPWISKRRGFFNVYYLAKDPIQQNKRGSGGHKQAGGGLTRQAGLNGCAPFNYQYFFAAATKLTNINKKAGAMRLFNEVSMYNSILLLVQGA
jgi:hypothetical protein